jgi:hypothetical protein
MGGCLDSSPLLMLFDACAGAVPLLVAAAGKPCASVDAILIDW